MPVAKPLQTYGEGSAGAVPRAGESTGRSRKALNAALGTDNFSSFLGGEKSGAQSTQAQQMATPISSTPSGQGQNSAALMQAQQAFAIAQQQSQNVPAGSAVLGETINSPALQAAGMGPSARLIHGGAGAIPTAQAQAAPTATQNLAASGIPQSNAINARFGGISGGGYDPSVPRAQGNLSGMSQAQKLMMMTNSPLSMLNSVHRIDASRPTGTEGAVMNLRSAAHKAAQKVTETAGKVVSAGIGALSSMFESGKDGIAAIGYDRTGGTSYGKYQIASKTGSMDGFISYLKKEAPDLAKELGKAGKADTGSKQGAMPEAWKRIAAREPERFESLQHGFIMQTHFDPALNKVAELTGIDLSALSGTMQEVLFSTAVQHGPSGAGKIVARAMARVGEENLTSNNKAKAEKAEEMLIRQVYDIRAGQFGSSTGQVQAAVKNRLNSEMGAALKMFNA